MSLSRQFFLGANSRYGFHSLYESFCPPEDGCFLHIIKGGPGCGKSSFMRRIGAAAEKEGLEVEYILCSGDPDSLDGVFIPALKTGYADGTTPHALEAPYPGCRASYLDLGRFYDTCALQREFKEIGELQRQYKSHYASAYAAIAAGAAAMPRCMPEAALLGESEKLAKKAEAFARREFSPKEAKGKISRRFAEAICCRGRVFLSGSISADCARICLLDNELGLGHVFLSHVLRHAREKSQETLICYDCIDPKLISALLFPRLSLALVCSGPGQEDFDGHRHMHLDNLTDGENLSRLKPRMRRAKRLSRDCFAHAGEILASAKALHDELEAVYNPHVDFDGVYEEAQKHISILFGTQFHAK